MTLRERMTAELRRHGAARSAVMAAASGRSRLAARREHAPETLAAAGLRLARRMVAEARKHTDARQAARAPHGAAPRHHAHAELRASPRGSEVGAFCRSARALL